MLPEGPRDGVCDRPPSQAPGLASLYDILAGKASVQLAKSDESVLHTVPTVSPPRCTPFGPRDPVRRGETAGGPRLSRQDTGTVRGPNGMSFRERPERERPSCWRLCGALLESLG